jgi:hypothetical protein
MSSAQPEYGVREETLIRGAHGTIAEPEDTRTDKVVKVGVVCLALLGIGAVWAVFMWRAHTSAYAQVEPPMPAALSSRQYEVGVVNQWEFSRDTRGYQLTEQRARELGQYGWVNRQEGRIHLPVSEGIQAVIRGQQQQPPPAPPQPVPGQPAPQGGTPAPGGQQP